MAYMGRGYEKQCEIFDKLTIVAHGDSRLVQQAIAACCNPETYTADLGDVVEYLIKRRTIRKSR